MKLSKSKYCDAIQCNKILWLDTNIPEVKGEVTNESILDNGKEVGQTAKELFGSHIDIVFNNDLNAMIKATQKALKNKNVVITEASFKYQDNFCSVDILKKENNAYEIYEVKSSTEFKDIYLDDLSYQTYILLNLGYAISKACIIYLNSSYVRQGSLDLTKLFIIKDVTLEVFTKQKGVKAKINEINKYLIQKKEPEQSLGMHCVTPYECPFFTHCTKNLEKNNIFDLKGMRNSLKFKLYNQGIYTYKNLLKEDINDKYKQQISFELYDEKPIIKKDKIKEFINTLSYPIYFLDFETFQMPIPKYNNVKPYMQVPFQYSLHIMDKNDLVHKEFLAEADIDPRRSLAEKLVKDIPLNACTVAYNMSFEKMVIKNLANLYPDLNNHLMNIHGNMKDLMIPFKNRDYYTKEMHGSFSIKYVLPALFPNDPSLDYHNLKQVHNGKEAMNSYVSLGQLNKEKQEYLRNNLLEYCKLDTYAMVKIYEKLIGIIKDYNQ